MESKNCFFRMILNLNCLIPLLLLFSHQVSSGRSDETEILKTDEYPGGIYVGYLNVAKMSVLYRKPKEFNTEWLSETNCPANPFNLEVNTTKMNGTTNETLSVGTFFERSGNYTFRIFDPSTNATLQTANFTLKIYMEPSWTRISTTTSPRNLQLGQIYEIECSGKSLPLPTVRWEFKACTRIAVSQTTECDSAWKPLDYLNRTVGVQSPFGCPWQEFVTIRAEKIGTIRCVATNYLGSNDSFAIDKLPFEVIPSDINDTQRNVGLFISPQNEGTIKTYENDPLNLKCHVHKLQFSPRIVWTHTPPNETKTTLGSINADTGNKRYYNTNKTRYPIDLKVTSSNFSHTYEMEIRKLGKWADGIFCCKISPFETQYIINKCITVAVNKDFKPQITPESNNSKVFFKLGSHATLLCKVEAGPPASAIWYKNGKTLEQSNNSYIRRTLDGLEFIETYKADEGHYVCAANNRLGSAQRSFYLLEEPQSFFTQNKDAIVACVVSFILLIFIVLLVRLAVLNSRRNQDLWKLQKELEENEAEEFDPTLPIFEQIEKGLTMRPGYPYCLEADKLEIDRRNLVRLGEGFFGVVLQVGLKMLNGSVQPVALKRPKCNWDVEQYRMLYKEICLMTYLGKHPNIVNMIGCVLKVASGQLYMVMELCPGGSLLGRLKSLRKSENFRSEIQKSSELQKLNKSSQKAAPPGQTMKDSNFDLLSYAYQVACAMEYLASVKFVHRDLAARNVLLSDNCKIAKVSDFGLSHQMYCQQYYFQEKDEKMMLPRRSSAPESFLNREFSSGSDVWSFGTVLGEIFSLGEVPFAHVTDANFNPQQLITGAIRPLQPKWATDKIYQLILSCCEPKCEDRITFTEAKSQLIEEFRDYGSEKLGLLQAELDHFQTKSEILLSESMDKTIFHPYQRKSQPNLHTNAVHRHLPTLRKVKKFCVTCNSNSMDCADNPEEPNRNHRNQFRLVNKMEKDGKNFI